MRKHKTLPRGLADNDVRQAIHFGLENMFPVLLVSETFSRQTSSSRLFPHSGRILHPEVYTVSAICLVYLNDQHRHENNKLLPVC